jgi:hypothetical protein
MKLQEGIPYIGWAMEDITPDEPVLLHGQYYERKSEYIESRLTATAFAIETTTDTLLLDQAIMISIDLIWVTKEIQDLVKKKLRQKLDDFDVRKLFINATHTHSGPDPDVKSNYGDFLINKLVLVATEAWQNRKVAAVSDALGYAVVGHNRRVQYLNGTTEMYGAVDRDDFMGIEGPTDSGVGMIFCWDTDNELTGIIMNVSCPAQVTEAKYFVSADYWSEVRKQLKKKFSKNIYLLPQCGAAGDLSPRDLPRDYKAGEPNMWDAPGIVEIGKRLSIAVENAYELAKQEIKRSVIFQHRVIDLHIPTRTVSQQEYSSASEISAEIHSRDPKEINSSESAWNRFLAEIKENETIKQFGPWDNKNTDYGIVRKMDATIDQYNNKTSYPSYKMELHALRLGDVAIVSNSFELFLDYGFRIMGRSKAKQTFIVQLSCDYCDYLPTQRALKGGGYSAMANPVGPDGGKVLVDTTVELIHKMWDSFS